MMRRFALLGLLGLAIATGLFVWRGVGPVLTILATAGFGILWVAVAHLGSMAVNARAWQVLALDRPRPNLPKFFWAVWLRESVNGLLPVARVGGEVVTARLLHGYGMAMPAAIATLAVDVTLCMGTQLVFTFLGLGLFAWHQGSAHLAIPLATSALLLAVLAVLFYLVQRQGIFRLGKTVVDKMFGDRFRALTHGADSYDDSIRRVYTDRRAILACAVWQLAGWLMGAVEIGVALYFLGQNFTWTEVVIIEALVQAASSSAFVVPGALGVQEGSFVLVCGWLGLGSDAALALALTRRARDLLLFVPALVVWQTALSRKLLASGKPSRD